MRVTTPKELGALVRDRRRQKGFSQQDLANRAGVSRQWIVGLEQGRARAFGLVLRTLAVLELALEIVELKHSGSDESVDLDALLKSLDEEPS